MKKQQRPLDWEGHEEPSDEEFGEVLEELEGLGELDEDEIIDLEEIIELSEKSAGKDESAEGIENLDADGELDFPELDLDLGSGKGMGDTGEDLFKDFALSDEDLSALSDGEGLEVKILDESAPRGDKENLDLGDLMGFTGESASAEAPSEADFQVEQSDIDALFEGVGGGAGASVYGGGDASVEDLVSSIEARLVEVVQQMVESRLPGIVRSVLKEEIEQLRKEMEAGRGR